MDKNSPWGYYPANDDLDHESLFTFTRYSRVSEVITMKVDESVANQDICGRFCGTCPTYKENGLHKGQPNLLFCARGKSDKSPGEKMIGCKCPECGVHKRYKLTDDYYCTK